MIMKMDLVIAFTNNKLSIKVGKKWKKFKKIIIYFFHYNFYYELF